MKSIAKFLVKNRNAVLVVMTALTVLCAVLAFQVGINTDMTKYLADDSEMKIGLDLMEETFGDTASSSTIRVMAQGLDEEQEAELLEALENLEYVDSVSHDDSEDYNIDDYTLYILSTSYDYYSTEELAIESALENDFDEYGIVYHNDDTSSTNLSIWIIVVAFLILMVILTAMCDSWVEPVLFLINIGFAVIINAGTNIIFGEVSYITNEIAAILQLVLSMDYSVILMNRYRQELEKTPDSKTAMTNALSGAIRSIAGSSVTTFVGLLALCFMSYKIGMDIGLVLAKGVVCSLICTLTVLPALIVLFSNAIAKTGKPVLRIPTGGLAKFSDKFRYVLVPVFVVLFAAFFLLQNSTDLLYTYPSEDPIADIFPTTDTLVILYETEDEEAVAALAEELEDVDGITQVLGYPNLLGKEYTADALMDAMDGLTETFGMEIDESLTSAMDDSMLSMVYYMVSGGEAQDLTMSEFLTFLADDVLSNESFASLMDDDLTEQADYLETLADADALTEEKSIAELADFLGMEEDTLRDLMLYYYIQNGGAETGTMTLSTFAEFVIDEVAADETYADLFDEETLESLSQLETYTDAEAISAEMSGDALAEALGLDSDTMTLLLVYYYAQQEDYEPASMTIAELVSFLSDDVLTNETFAAYLDEDTSAQITQLAAYTDVEAVTAEQSAEALAAQLGIDEDMMTMIIALYFGEGAEDLTMDLATFTSYLNGMTSNALLADSFDESTTAELTQMNALIALAASGETLDAQTLADALGMDSAMVETMFSLYSAEQADPVTAMTMTDFIAFLTEDVLTNEAYAAYFDETTAAQLTQMNTLVALAVSGETLDAETLANALGMDSVMVEQLFALYASGQTTSVTAMTLTDFVTFLTEDVLTNEAYAAYFDETTAAELTQMNTLIQLAISGTELDASTLGSILGLDSTMVEQMFSLYAMQTGEAVTAMTLSDFITFLTEGVLTNETYAAYFDETTTAELTQMNALIDLAVSGAELDAQTLASAFGMDSAMVEQLFALYASGQTTGVTAMTMADFVTFLTEDVLTNEAYAAYFDETTAAELTQMNTLIQLAVSGTELDASTLGTILGLDSTMVEQMFSLYAMQTGEAVTAMTLSDFITFLTEGVLTNETYAAYFDETTTAELTQMDALIDLAVSGAELDAETLANAFGMDSAMVEQLFALYDAADDAETVTGMSLSEFIAFLNDSVLTNEAYAAYFDETTSAQLAQMSTLIDLAVSGAELDAQTLASAFGMDSAMVEQMFTLYAMNNAEPVTGMTMSEFIAFLNDSVLTNEAYAAYFDETTSAQLAQMSTLIDLAVSGQALSASEMAAVMGLDEETAGLLYQLYAGQTSGSDTISLYNLIHYIADDLSENSLFADYFDESTLSSMQQLVVLMDAAVSETAFSAADVTELLGLDEATARMLYTYHDAVSGAAEDWTLSLVDLVDFLTENSESFADMMDADSLSALATGSAVMHGTLDGTEYTCEALAELVGMDAEQLEQLYLLYISRHGDTSDWTISISELIEFIADDVLESETYADMIDADSREELEFARTLIEAVLSGEAYTAAETAEMLSAMSDSVTEDTMELLYLYYASVNNGDAEQAISIADLFTYISDVLLEDSRFDAFISDDVREEILSLKSSLDEGIEMLRGETYSRMMVYTTLSAESDETTAFMDSLTTRLEELDVDAWLIGNMAMTYEMQNSFRDELNFITLLTAIAIYIVVMLTFRSLIIPLILVLIVQCGVYITITAAGALSGSIFYLALVIVECILMGATIDYGILFANYYRDIRRSGAEIKDALAQSYKGSIQTITTSGLIMILVTGILSCIVDDPTIAEIVQIVSMGALSAVLLILFVLPGLLAAFDRWVVGKKKE